MAVAIRVDPIEIVESEPFTPAAPGVVLVGVGPLPGPPAPMTILRVEAVICDLATINCTSPPAEPERNEAADDPPPISRILIRYVFGGIGKA